MWSIKQTEVDMALVLARRKFDLGREPVARRAPDIFGDHEVAVMPHAERKLDRVGVDALPDLSAVPEIDEPKREPAVEVVFAGNEGWLRPRPLRKVAAELEDASRQLSANLELPLMRA